jgi:hypothetical protein
MAKASRRVWIIRIVALVLALSMLGSILASIVWR